MTVQIPLTQGQFAIVDDEDAERVLAQGKWFAVRSASRFYAGRKVRREGGGQRMLYMHTFLMGQARPDHINGDGLDNRRANLRPATQAENNRNRGKGRNNTSGYKGVSWHKQTGKWWATICVDRQKRSLGLHADPESAARAYDEAASLHFGEFARLNFPSPARGVADHTSRG